MRPIWWNQRMGEVPDLYLLRVTGRAPDGQRWMFWQALSPEAVEGVGWFLLAICTRWMTDKLRDKGAEPEEWTCDGEWLPEEVKWADAMHWSPA